MTEVPRHISSPFLRIKPNDCGGYRKETVMYPIDKEKSIINNLEVASMKPCAELKPDDFFGVIKDIVNFRSPASSELGIQKTEIGTNQNMTLSFKDATTKNHEAFATISYEWKAPDFDELGAIDTFQAVQFSRNQDGSVVGKEYSSDTAEWNDTSCADKQWLMKWMLGSFLESRELARKCHGIATHGTIVTL